MVRLISSDVELKTLLRNIGCDLASYPIFFGKDEHVRVWIDNVHFAAASVIKQECLSCGADAAVHKHVITGKVDTSSVLIMANVNQLRCIAEKVKRMPYWGLPHIAEGILSLPIFSPQKNFVLHMPHGGVNISDTKIMAILNVTPDSFFAASRVDLQSGVDRAVDAEMNGATFLDIGGESTRPGASAITEDEEISRVIPLLRQIRKATNLFISVDTYRASVARQALDNGADLINDIYGLQQDKDMAKVIAETGVPVVLMHMRGTPSTMGDFANYDDIMKELLDHLKRLIDFALGNGIKEDQIILDPGIGFAKTPEHNLEIMKRIEELFSLGFPVLVGHSRKSTLGKILDGAPPEGRLFGTVAWTSYLAWKGINIVRVHDTKENVDAVKAINAIKHGTY